MCSFKRTGAVSRETARDIVVVCLAYTLVGASFGAIATSGGLVLWVPVVMSLLVFAGSAQFAALGVVLGGGSPAAGVVAGLVLNARLLPFGFAVSGTIGGGKRRLLGVHLINDVSVAFSMRHGEGRAAYWASALSLFAVWNVSVLLGALAGSGIGDTDALGLDAAMPAMMLALVLPALRDRRTRDTALLGAVIAAAATPFLPAGLPVLLALAGLVLLALPPRPPGREGSR